MTTVGGLPAHILLVHAVVVLVPLTALLVVLEAVWPAARQRLVWATAVLAVVMMISVPLTTEAGEWLERRVPSTELVRAHTELGDFMLPWAIALTAVALAFAVRELVAVRAGRRAAHETAVAHAGSPGTARPATVDRGREGAATAGPGGRIVSVALAIVALVVAVGSVATVYRIGESGSNAVWTGQVSDQPLPRSFPPGGPPAGG